MLFFFFFQAEDGIRDLYVTGVQTCALPIWLHSWRAWSRHVPVVASTPWSPCARSRSTSYLKPSIERGGPRETRIRVGHRYLFPFTSPCRGSTGLHPIQPRGRCHCHAPDASAT